MLNCPTRDIRVPLLRCLTATALALVTAACAESAMGPEAVPPESQRSNKQAVARAHGKATTSPYACFASFATPSGPHAYRYRYFYLHFPKEAIAPDGATTRYRFRANTHKGEVGVLANCIVPRTIPAVRQMNRFFKAPPHTGIPAEGGQPDGEIIVLGGCSEDVTEGCVIVGDPGGSEPPPPSEEPKCDINTTQNCDNYPGTGDGGDPGGSSGGNDPCSSCEPPPAPCSTGDQTIDDPAVQAGYKELWAASNPNGNLYQRVEAAGWVVRTPNGTFAIESWNIQGANYCGWSGTPPAATQGTVVGFVHTHPYAVGENVLNCEGQVVTYTGEPSLADRQTSAQLGPSYGYGSGLPGYILDKNGLTKFVGYTEVVDQRYSRCGY